MSTEAIIFGLALVAAALLFFARSPGKGRGGPAPVVCAYCGQAGGTHAEDCGAPKA